MSEDQVSLPLFVVGAEDTPILFANLVVAQHIGEEFVITFGQYTPPLALGPDPVEQLKNTPYVPVKVVARVGMTPQRLQELIEVLQTNLKNWQQQRGS